MKKILSFIFAICLMIIGRLDIYPVILATLVTGQDVKNYFKKLIVKGNKDNV